MLFRSEADDLPYKFEGLGGSQIGVEFRSFDDRAHVGECRLGIICHVYTVKINLARGCIDEMGKYLYGSAFSSTVRTQQSRETFIFDL